MPNRQFRSQAEQAAYALGLQDAKPPEGEPLTLDAIKAMDTQEVAARLDEVNEVLARGPVEQQEDGEDDA